MIQWITSHIGTAPYGADQLAEDCERIDIRDLVDRYGNTGQNLCTYIDAALHALQEGKRVVINCDHGISRSNALAVAVLSRWEEIPMSLAVQRVLQATDNAEIRLEVLDAVRRAMNEKSLNKLEERWLVTGGHGYLGSLLVSSSSDNVVLYTPSHTELNLTGAAALDLYVREHGITRIIHLAAPKVGNVNSAMGDSVVMLKNIMDVAITNDIPLIFPSRWEVFGGYKSQAFYAEETLPLKPNGVVGFTKYIMETMAKQYMDNFGLKLTIVRCGLVYGHGGAPNFIKNFIQKAMEVHKITTHQYRDGLPMLDLIHADDWRQGFWTILQSGANGTFHLGSGCPISTKQIAEIISEAARCRCELAQIQLDENVSNIILGAQRMAKDFGWKPAVNHSEMIDDLVHEMA